MSNGKIFASNITKGKFPQYTKSSSKKIGKKNQQPTKKKWGHRKVYK